MTFSSIRCIVVLDKLGSEICNNPAKIRENRHSTSYHEDPAVGGGALSLEELNRLPWSVHSGVVGDAKQPWQDTGYIRDF